MTRNWSLLILLGTVVAIGVLFIRVVWPFLFPLLFASILAILFRPVYEWTCQICFGRRRLAAVLTTLGVILVVMLPLSGALVLAGIELVDAGKDIVKAIELPENAADAKRLIDPQQYPQLHEWLNVLETRLSEEDVKQVRELISSALLAQPRTFTSEHRA